MHDGRKQVLVRIGTHPVLGLIGFGLILLYVRQEVPVLIRLLAAAVFFLTLVPMSVAAWWIRLRSR